MPRKGDHPNKYKWLRPPTIEQIKAKLEELNVSGWQFERFHGMPQNCIAKVACGIPLPVKFWHFFLEEPKELPEQEESKKLPEQKEQIKANRKVSPKKKQLSPVLQNALKDLM